MFATPEDAELAFYEAFARGDIEAMRDVWLDEDSIICIHPGSDILQGRTAVHASWTGILQNPPPIRHQVAWRSQGPLQAVNVGREWVAEDQGRTVILSVTNVFQITPEGWRMLLHHSARLGPGTAATTDTPIH